MIISGVKIWAAQISFYLFLFGRWFCWLLIFFTLTKLSDAFVNRMLSIKPSIDVCFEYSEKIYITILIDWLNSQQFFFDYYKKCKRMVSAWYFRVFQAIVYFVDCIVCMLCFESYIHLWLQLWIPNTYISSTDDYLVMQKATKLALLLSCNCHKTIDDYQLSIRWDS